MTMIDGVPLVDACTVQKFLADTGISKTTLYRQVRAGRIALRKFGGISMVDGESARRWFNQLPPVEARNSSPPSPA